MRIIVTGSERGIGKAITKELEARNHSCYGFSRRNGIDVADYKCVVGAFEELSRNPSEGSSPEILINNAGTVEMGTVLELSPEGWKKQIEVNLNGVFYCCKEFIKMRKNLGGKIINIASTSAIGPRPGRSAYAASKAAVVSLSLSLAEECRPYGIKVYCISPGACDTDLRHKINPDDDFANMMKPYELANFVADIVEDGYMLDSQVIMARRALL